jgi:Uma2 family endonuclease
MTAPVLEHSSYAPSTSTPVETKISWAEFRRDYAEREDGFKYEWLNGVVEKSTKTMDYTQFFIQKNLTVFFYKLLFTNQLEGQLLAEGDMFFIEQHRRPDLAYLTDAAIELAADGIRPTPKFVIEIVSDTDAIIRVYKKMQDYRLAKVKVAWLIFPQLNEVHVHTGDNLDKIQVFSGEQICSAAPVLPVFEMAVNAILKRGK